ncbi:hypothetical protein MOQ72_43240 [Saccharopolyspora sp. K220]|uniref:hypothetical protein n=1 Tax=Saccharopolyspora soli TaxID=2926618 RepID=UPI001F56AC84|nr:hypothetical protein [Saccharopolyspora soli]MCI2424229.1 hypothetical protein [Saccharopolyspora soli]
MVKRRTGLVIAAIASVGGVIAGAVRYQLYQLERWNHLGVTLYSEPHYRGTSQTLTCTDSPQSFCSLRETGLPRVGSIRVQRRTDAFRPALFNVLVTPLLAWTAITSTTSKVPEAGDWRYRLLEHMLYKLNPNSWRVERDPTGDKQSWVRLWADQPTYPLPPRDEATTPDEQPWHDVLTDAPDLGPWSTRTRYRELGVRNPHHTHSLAHPGFDT